MHQLTLVLLTLFSNFFVMNAYLSCTNSNIIQTTRSSYASNYIQVGQSSLKSNSKDEIREEQWRIQQEMLARRKNKTQMKDYFNKVEENRKSVSKEAKKTIWTKESNDPLIAWKQAKSAGKIKPLGYEPEPTKEDSKLGFNVVIPLNPIGVPKYDAGERFDLRLPYAERGYEDPDADVMGKFMTGISSLFGGEKKSVDAKDDEDNSKKTNKNMEKK